MIIMTPAVLPTITKYFHRAELGEGCVPPKGVKGPRGDYHVNVVGKGDQSGCGSV